MKIRNFYVDFNDMVEADLVLFSRDDTKRDFNGESVPLYEGMEVTVFMEDRDENGIRDDLRAHGYLELNTADDWSRNTKWCCRLDENDIRHESDIAGQFDDFWRIRGSGIHDASIVGFSYVSDGGFLLTLRASDGSSRNITFPETVEMGFRNFMKNAIVGDIFCWPLKTIKVTPAVSEAYAVLAGDSYIAEDCANVVSRLQAKYPDSFLVSVSCTYGGDIALVCGEAA